MRARGRLHRGTSACTSSSSRRRPSWSTFDSIASTPRPAVEAPRLHGPQRRRELQERAAERALQHTLGGHEHEVVVATADAQVDLAHLHALAEEWRHRPCARAPGFVATSNTSCAGARRTRALITSSSIARRQSMTATRRRRALTSSCPASARSRMPSPVSARSRANVRLFHQIADHEPRRGFRTASGPR